VSYTLAYPSSAAVTKILGSPLLVEKPFTTMPKEPHRRSTVLLEIHDPAVVSRISLINVPSQEHRTEGRRVTLPASHLKVGVTSKLDNMVRLGPWTIALFIPIFVTITTPTSRPEGTRKSPFKSPTLVVWQSVQIPDSSLLPSSPH
jgi:hypothetical protein